MKLGISNIAWSPEEEAAAYDLLHEQGISFLEIAPSRQWPDPAEAKLEDASRFRRELTGKHLSVAAFQAILFGKLNLILFRGIEARQACLDYLTHLTRLAAACGAGPMVFGAPKNRRVPPEMSLAEADHIAVTFFGELAARAADSGVCFCLEPNPTGYDCNYLTHVADVGRIVRRVDSPGLRLQIDAGELAMNAENVEQVIAEHADIIGHVHISQPMLGDFEKPWAGHQRLSRALAGVGYRHLVSIEMKRPGDGLSGVRRAIEFAKACYEAV